MTTRATKKSINGKAKRTSQNAVKAKVSKQRANLQIEDIPIGKISPDPNQPRKTFNEDSLQLLSQSIREHGILQPITVRKSEKNFIIVMGERRYRASKLAGKKTIPCMIKEYSNSNILEVQIIENLQRRDVEPTEEAEAISYLSQTYNPSEIAQRLGRTENFVRQRIKLAGLIEGFKTFVRNGEMTLSLAISVALFETEDQQMMLETVGEEFNAHQIKRLIENKTFDLYKAPFDFNDEALIEKVGACTTCPFNTANQGNLFGEGKMICTKASCFETKKHKTFLNLIERVKEENIYLIPDTTSYWIDDEHNQFFISEMEKHGLKIYLKDDVGIREYPTRPTTESIAEEYRYYECTEEELKTYYNEALFQYEEEKEIYDVAKHEGYSQAILIDPKTYIQRPAFIMFLEKEERKDDAKSTPLSNRKMVDCSPEEQIIKIKEREARKQHIENNKLFEEVATMIRETDYVAIKTDLSEDELVAISISLFENTIGYTYRQKYFSKLFAKTSKLSEVEQVEHFKKNFKKETLNQLIRILLIQQVHFGESNHINNLTNASFYKAISPYHKDNILMIEDKYEKEHDMRQARLKERIKSLKKKQKTLSAQ